MKPKNPFKVEWGEARYLAGKFIGGYVSSEVAGQLRLLALYKNETISAVHNRIIEDWVAAQESEEVIIEALTDRALLEWFRREEEIKDSLRDAPNDPEVISLRELHNWPHFEHEVRKTLRKRKIQKVHIRKVIASLRRKTGRKDGKNE